MLFGVEPKVLAKWCGTAIRPVASCIYHVIFRHLLIITVYAHGSEMFTVDKLYVIW